MSGLEAYTASRLSAGDGTPLALHRWAPSDTSEVHGLLFYVHGIQSHAGWLFETGPELARRGVATYALDRRGSGRSGGLRGDLPSAEVVLDDYRAGLRAARRDLPEATLTLLGQSFGGSVLAALVATGVTADRFVYCTPALGQQRFRHAGKRLDDMRALTGLTYSPIALADEDYTDQARYLEFMANDHLMLRQITERTRATMVELEDTYVDWRGDPGIPVDLVRAELDPIIAIEPALRVLSGMHPAARSVTFPVRRHYMEFSAARRDYWDWLARAVLRPVDDRVGSDA